MHSGKKPSLLAYCSGFQQRAQLHRVHYTWHAGNRVPYVTAHCFWVTNSWTIFGQTQILYATTVGQATRIVYAPSVSVILPLICKVNLYWTALCVVLSVNRLVCDLTKRGWFVRKKNSLNETSEPGAWGRWERWRAIVPRRWTSPRSDAAAGWSRASACTRPRPADCSDDCARTPGRCRASAATCRTDLQLC